MTAPQPIPDDELAAIKAEHGKFCADEDDPCYWDMPENCATLRLVAEVETLREREGDVWREVADYVAEQGEELYPRDVFPPPSRQTWAAVNDLLRRERGHQLDGIAAECMRRAYAGAARRIRERAEDTDDG